MKSKPLQTYLEPDLIEWLTDIAAQRRCSVSRVLKSLVVEAFRAAHEKEEEETCTT
jgi:hypothetical protein